MLLDLFSRKVVGWATSANPRQELALETLDNHLRSHQHETVATTP
jgi:transposase InsO family protein